MQETIKNINIDLLIPFENHPFKKRDGIENEELKESIQENGLLQPIIVRSFSAGTYEINVYTDFDRFEDNCRRMETEINPKAQSELYQGAVELYRGDLFSKISYQHWLMPKTAYYHNIFLRIIKCYIERKMEQGDYCAAHRAVVDAMSLDPYDSELNTDMILIMHHRGGAELAKSFLQTAKAYMSEEQIESVQQFWERT